jgi:hypothetical protein
MQRDRTPHPRPHVIHSLVAMGAHAALLALAACATAPCPAGRATTLAPAPEPVGSRSSYVIMEAALQRPGTRSLRDEDVAPVSHIRARALVARHRRDLATSRMRPASAATTCAWGSGRALPRFDAAPSAGCTQRAVPDMTATRLRNAEPRRTTDRGPPRGIERRAAGFLPGAP